MTDLFPSHRMRGGVTDADRNERAQRAVKVFRSMQFSLTSFARAITGNPKISVEMKAGVPHTDGKKIYYQPPIALGDPTEHERRLCEKRDETKLLRCPACAMREKVMVNIFHEIGHIAFDSFKETTDADRKRALTEAIEEWGGKYADRIKARIEATPWEVTRSYMGLASLVNPFLPYLVNCIEDARVDSAMFEARNGVRTMMQADMYQLFSQGTENPDGTVTMWRDMPLNSQASIGCYIIGAGFTGWEEWLHPEVVESLHDEKLNEILAEVQHAGSATDTYNLSFPVLARLRELGFFKRPEDQDDEDQDEQDDDAEPEGESSEAGDSDEDGEGEAEDSDSDPSEADSSEGDEAEADDREDGESGQDGDGAEEPAPGASPDLEADNGDSESSEGPEDEEGEVDDDADPGEEGSPGGDPVPDEAGSDGGDSDDTGADDESDDQSTEGADGEPEASDGGEDSEDRDTEAAEGDEGSAGDPSSSDDEGMAGGTPERTSGSEEADGSDEDSSEGGSDGLDEGHGGQGTDDDSDGDSREGSRPERDSLDTADPPEGESTERLDTGADDGTGGLETPNTPEYGDPEDVGAAISQFHKDEVAIDHTHGDEKPDAQAVEVAIIQGLYFETPSTKVLGVREHTYGVPSIEGGQRVDQAWANERYVQFGDRYALGIEVELDVPESVLGPALLQTRRVFTDNAKANHQHNLKTGRINKRVLGRRAWNDDPRLFSKKRLPGKRSYAVLIGIDVSGSTIGENLALAKRAAWAQAELCNRVGIDFAVYAHSASGMAGRIGRSGPLNLDIYKIKEFGEPWDPKVHQRIRDLGSDSENLDGHTIEYYRKRLDEVNATDKIILYYTDGKMPAANHDEELEILQREIKVCKQKSYTLLGVGIRTDSPIRHGLDTVQVNDDNDLKSVVMHLEKVLVRN